MIKLLKFTVLMFHLFIFSIIWVVGYKCIFINSNKVRLVRVGQREERKRATGCILYRLSVSSMHLIFLHGCEC